jgi:8-oxo-dGTP pyrophosphatase MutT (NUDIX family)
MPERTMLNFDIGNERFSVRAAAIIIRDGHVLIHRGVHESFWTLPGGRVELRETSARTVEREIEEEMATTAIVGPLRFLVENFFDLGGRRFHEFGFYYSAELTGPFPFSDGGEVCFHSRDGGSDLEFAWVAARESVLAERNFKPALLRGLLAVADGGMKHLVAVET